jgi:uncharacterized repeat protein (TIGR03803 family)
LPNSAPFQFGLCALLPALSCAIGLEACSSSGTVPSGTSTLAKTVNRFGSSRPALQNYRVLYSFGGTGTGPVGVTFGSHGQLFGTTGGSYTSGDSTLYELTPAGSSYSERTLYNFSCSTDGCVPESAPLYDPSTGDLFVDTSRGGPYGQIGGSIVKFSRSGKNYARSAVFFFTPGYGNQPSGPPLLLNGTIYTTTAANGGNPKKGKVGRNLGGDILSFTPSDLQPSFLHYFHNGSAILGNLVANASGDLFGEAFTDSLDRNGAIYRFQLTGDGGKNRTLYRFQGGSDGSLPTGVLSMDEAGNLYGTTEEGGGPDLGVIFKLTRKGNEYKESLLHIFMGATDGEYPTGVTLVGKTLWGTTILGGDENCSCGTIYSLSSSGTGYAVQHMFMGPDGSNPDGPPILHDGKLYGTTDYGGASSDPTGVVYEFTP